MSEKIKSYIAGFLDGDGCIMAQLIRRKDYIFGYQIRLSIVFYQKTKYKHHLEWLKQKLQYGYVRERKDGMSEYTIVGLAEVKNILQKLLPFLHLKKNLAKLIIRIAKMPKRPSMKQLIHNAQLVDKSAQFNYSKKRVNTTKELLTFLKKHHFPVETEPRSLQRLR